MIYKNLFVSFVCLILLGMFVVHAAANNGPTVATAPPPAAVAPAPAPMPAPSSQPQAKTDPNVVVVKVGVAPSWLESFKTWLWDLLAAIPFTAILTAVVFFTIVIYIYLYLQRRQGWLSHDMHSSS